MTVSIIKIGFDVDVQCSCSCYRILPFRYISTWWLAETCLLATQTRGLMFGVLTLVTEWWIRVVVIASLSAHVVLALLAGIRRRQAYGFWMLVLWLAYQAADKAAPFVLSNLSLGSTPLEQQLIVFWLPSVVTHLGGADNITAYSLDDNKLSLRLYASAFLQIISIAFLMYKQVSVVTSKGPLFWASVVMVAVGACKYLERVGAFWKAGFGNIRSSIKFNPGRLLKIQLGARSRKVLGNEQALLVAHELLGITKGAFSDGFLGKQEEDHLKKDANLKQIFYVEWEDNTGWENMCKVVEMELSLMYDILYTKAAVSHSWFGYAIRMVSPVVTATVILLFSLRSEEGQRRADVIIIYILLAVTFLLDVRWLLGAAASTWTHAFFNDSPARWLHHEVCCTRRWHRLRCFVVSLDRWQLPLRDHGGGYRLWSGAMGQYNLLHEVIHCTTSRLGSLMKTLGQEDAWMDYKFCSRLQLQTSKNVKDLLLRHIKKALNMAPPPKVEPKEPPPPPKKEEPSPPPKFPEAAPTQQRRRELDEELDFLPEFQELILIWHVATDVFLLCSHKQRAGEEQMRYVEAIKAVSDYMAFLAAVRPDMLPGLKLRSQHQATVEALSSLWNASKSTSPNSTTGKEEQLVEVLKSKEREVPENAIGKSKRSKESALYNFSIILSDGIKFGELLGMVLSSEDSKGTLDVVLHEGSNSWKRFVFLIPEMEARRPNNKPFNMLMLLELILKSWVRMLIYVSIRCGRDSHAKQLGRGCELTTIVWILSEHAGIFAPKKRDGR